MTPATTSGTAAAAAARATPADRGRIAAHLGLAAVVVAAQWVALERADAGRPEERLALLGHLLAGWGPVVVLALGAAVAAPRAGRAGGWLTGAAWGGWLAATLPVPLVVTTGVLSRPDAWEAAATAVVCALPAVALRGRAAFLAVPLVLAAVASDLPAARTLPEPASAAPMGPPIVLVTLDTVRADHVSAIARPTGALGTPAVDALAARGWLFTHGVAPAPLTGPSHAGLLTGLPPHAEGVLRNGDPLPAGVGTVAESLHAAGYRTGAFVSSAVLDRRTGLDRGFERYDDRFGARARVADRLPWSTWRHLDLAGRPPLQRDGMETLRRALRWFREPSDRPTFLWLHLYDPHAPYLPPPAFEVDPAGLADRAGPAEIEAWRAWQKTWLGRRGEIGFGRPERIRRQVAAYAGEVAYVDEILAEAVRTLPPDTRWVVAADHGESLVEHGYVMNHGRHVFESTTRVPIVVAAPTLPPGVVTHPVPSWLVGDTVRALAGLRVGHSLLDEDATPWADPIVTFAPGQEARVTFGLGRRGAELSLRQGTQKWIVGPERRWRIDLATDPEERAPVLVDDATSAEAARLLEALEAAERPDTSTGEWLRALGYVE